MAWFRPPNFSSIPVFNQQMLQAFASISPFHVALPAVARVKSPPVAFPISQPRPGHFRSRSIGTAAKSTPSAFLDLKASKGYQIYFWVSYFLA